MNLILLRHFRELKTQIILSFNKEMMQLHFWKKVIVLLAAQWNLEKSIYKFVWLWFQYVFNNYPVGSVLYMTW